MLRLLSASWSDFLVSLLDDLAPLGFAGERSGEQVSVTLTQPATLEESATFWDQAHQHRHLTVITQHAETILEFEARHADVFAQMRVFQPSAIRPVLEIVDFSDRRHRAIVEYLGLCQSVMSRRRVGRQMGLLVWDHGQTAHRPLIGAAVLASPRYSQRLRDGYLGWAPHYPKTSARHDPHETSVREAGLGRMMQLSMAYALPPYSLLSGSRLIAMAPFTDVGQEAFAGACRHEEDPDLAAVVTTTGKGPSGFPFRNQRIGQLSNRTIEADSQARGDVFAHIRPYGSSALYASFEDLVSSGTVRMACDLMRTEEPKQFSSAKHVERMSMSYCLKRLSLSRDIFRGNEMGVHIGMLGAETRAHLADGTPRPHGQRPRLDWDTVVAVWTQRFLPASDGVAEAADEKDRVQHLAARRRRNARGKSCRQSEILLSSQLPQ
ncbi:DUF4338 domain-containing protein [Mycolicibacterium wolinskyi]|uniref:Uncharacterized protein n=1 Tax=Mycolicibacterium wolinskyi TaxID=59750 RepID=A0A1X2F7K4_9MYCO|nr:MULTISPECIES: Druantia anti-phage system protein DruA [Mycolicibacterium]MCV7286883.1 DUF4338 domain-containing protein [Mycolicibacterium wolinskyi]MCV7293864.1 DUF4338 domain-containing protein [Mycolicibacterium goodii]ORX14441.1 hypothetical protein AWC31_24885 [Mycolicibacterium wolinskyi]